MNTSKILPIAFPPPITIYPHHYNILSIVMSRANTLEWFYSNYIQLCAERNYKTNSELLNFYPMFYTGQSSIFITLYRLNEKIINITKDSIIDCMLNWLDNDFYVGCFLNEAELPGTFMYTKKWIYLHEQFVFGYNKEKNTFKIINFDENKNLSFIDVSVVDFRNAFSSKKTTDLIKKSSWCDGNKIFIVLYKFNENVQFKLNINYIRNQILEYIHSENSSVRYSLLDNVKSKNIFGMKIYEILKEYLLGKRTKFIDYRAFHGLWEHKKIMKDRIEYMMKKSYIKQNNSYIEKLSEIEQISNKLKLMIFKYNIIKDESLKKRFVQMIDKIRDIEYPLLNEVVKDIE